MDKKRIDTSNPIRNFAVSSGISAPEYAEIIIGEFAALMSGVMAADDDLTHTLILESEENLLQISIIKEIKQCMN